MNVPTSVTVRIETPAVAAPVFLTVTLPLTSEETTRLGSGDTTVQDAVAGSPMFPAESVARTRTLCSPTASPPNDAGLAQAAYAPASSEHSNATPVSLAVNPSVAARRRWSPTGRR